MAIDYLHNHPDFADLIRIVAEKRVMVPALVEKDYWIMHCLYGLQQLNLRFELKGGTSLSKGFGIIKRFSEDIDIRIEPPKELDVKTGRNHSKPAQVESRRRFYDWLATTIQINGILEVVRDHAFDEPQYRSGGIRLYDNPRIAENEAFLLSTPETRRLYTQAYQATSALYYQEQPTFDKILQAIVDVVETL